MKIKKIEACEILDSKSHPTVSVQVELEDGTVAISEVPSGASTGAAETLELRDGDPKRYNGKGVLKAVKNVNTKIRGLLIGKDVYNQREIDMMMVDLDGTENKSRLGGNAIVGTSMAVCRSAAKSQKIPLYEYFGQLSGNSKFELTQPQILLLEGGKHGNWSTDCQEYFVIPKREKFPNFAEMLRAGAEIFQALGEILDSKGYATGVGFEGAYMPKEMKSNEEAFELMVQAIEKAGYRLQEEVLLGVDAAASEFYHQGQYVLKSESDLRLISREWTEKIIGWTKKYPIWSMEDMHAEEDWEEWVYFTSQVGDKIQVIGDDLLTTNVKRIKKAIDLKAVNSVIIKPNQIGTVTETLEAIKLADSAGFTTVVSHRGGETNDDMIADLVIGTTSWQSKFGGPDRGERVSKYNRLLWIERELTKTP